MGRGRLRPAKKQMLGEKEGDRYLLGRAREKRDQRPCEEKKGKGEGGTLKWTPYAEKQIVY